jgi:hypothetical protein
VTTPRLLGLVYLALVVLGLAGGWVWIGPVVCLAALVGVGELWLRALTAERVPPVARIGLAIAAGLVSLPLVAVALHLARVPIAARPLLAGLAALTTVVGAVALVRERAGRPPAGRRRRTVWGFPPPGEPQSPTQGFPPPGEPQSPTQGFPPPGAPRSPTRESLPGPVAAVAIPAVLALVIGGAAVLAYVRLPHPPQPGYTSVALNGWAAGIDRPVAIPARGLSVPIRVSSAGEPSATAPLRVRVGDRPAGPARPLRIGADTTRSVDVYVPPPPDGCPHRIEISVGAASTVFYGHGPAAC